MKNQDVFDQMIEKWPSAIVARTEIRQFSGGAIGGKFMANLDSQKKGPDGRFKIGRKTVYPVASVASWLRGRSQGV